MAKKKIDVKSEREKKFSMGVIFVGVGVVFMTSVSQALGVVFIAVGGLWMMSGAREKNKVR